MPSLGDFFRVNAPRSFVEPWDIWMQTGIREVRRDLGNDWSACYMSAPIWRFTLSAGTAGPDAVFGVVMPSVDRVGREFPLTLMAPVPEPASLLDLHFGAKSTFEVLENLALDALEDEMTPDWISRLLSQISIPVVLSATDVPEGAADQFHSMVQPSIWTADLAFDPRLMICEGLPCAVQLRGLMDLNAPVWRATSRTSEPIV